jgi:hypothetical protein
MVNGEAPGTITSVPGVGYVFRGQSTRPAANPVLATAPVVSGSENGASGPSKPSLVVFPVPPA